MIVVYENASGCIAHTPTDNRNNWNLGTAKKLPPSFSFPMQLFKNVAAHQPRGRCCCSRSCASLLSSWPKTLSHIRDRHPGPQRMSHLLGHEVLGGSSQKVAAVSGVSVSTGSSRSLDFKPTLSLPLEALCCALAALSSAGVALAWKKILLTQTPVLFSVLLFAIVWQLIRNELLEQQYKAATRSFLELGDDESLWRTVGGSAAGAKGLQVHVKLCVARFLDSTGGLLGVHCYHGFGANLYSYAQVQRMMADRLGGVVTSHDAPGFGLTERPKDVPSYFLTYNGRLGAEVLEAELQAVQQASTRRSDSDMAVASSSKDTQPGAPLRPASPVSVLDGAQGSCASALSLDAPLLPEDQGTPGSSTTSIPSEDDAVVRVEAPADSPAIRDADGVSVSTRAGVHDGSPPQSSSQPTRILLGHSLGGICASLAALDQHARSAQGTRQAGSGDGPAPIAALVLVAPAVIAMQGGTQSLVEMQEHLPSALLGVEPNRVQRFACSAEAGASNPAEASPSRPHNRQQQKQPFLQRAQRAALTVAQGVLLLCLLVLLQAVRPVIIAVLRSLVRSRAFWVKGLQQAYHDPSAVTDEVVDAYRLPQMVRGWESGMFMFLVSRISHMADPKAWLARASAAIAVAGDPEGEEEVGLAHRLSSFVSATGLPVLVIHGETDRLVPLSNSQRLAAFLPGAELAVIKACGHMPQEECPRLFTELVHDFVERRVRPRSTS